MALTDLATVAYGHDWGNSETCGVMIATGNKSVFRSMPSASSPGTLKDLRNLGVPLEEDHYVYSDATTSGVYIGRLAIEQAYASFSGRDDETRYESVHSLRALLTSAAAMTKAKRFALNVVTGIPVALYKDDEPMRKKITETLNGEYAFFINGQERVARISTHKVIMEGAAALRPYGLRDKAGMPDKVTPQAVIDIGGGTTDLVGAVGQTHQTYLCNNIQLGVENVMDSMIANFKAVHDKRRLVRMETRNILRAYVSKGDLPFPPIYDNGKQISDEELSRFVKEALDEIGARIISFIKSTWKDEVGRFAVILLIGGGAYYFHDILKAAFPQVKLVYQPEGANALGYAMLANNALQKALAEK